MFCLLFFYVHHRKGRRSFRHCHWLRVCTKQEMRIFRTESLATRNNAVRAHLYATGARYFRAIIKDETPNLRNCTTLKRSFASVYAPRESPDVPSLAITICDLGSESARVCDEFQRVCFSRLGAIVMQKGHEIDRRQGRESGPYRKRSSVHR